MVSRRLIEKAAIVKQVRQRKGEVGPEGRRSAGQVYYTAKVSPNQEVIGDAVHLWDEVNVGLDSSSEHYLMTRARALPTIVRLSRPGVVDLKGPNNIHSWEKLKNYDHAPCEWQHVVPELKEIEVW